MNNEKIEDAIQQKGLNAPRITPDHVKSKCKATTFHRFPGSTTTVCLVVLENGFTVLGESACASPENYDQELGEKIAFANAVDKVWALEGYLLKEQLWQGENENKVSMELIARACHEVNRAYCLALGDFSQPEWNEAPQWQKDSAINGVLFHLASPEAGPEASHENWREEKRNDGWVWGEEKDPEAKKHPCMVPFDDLPPEQKVKDFLFRQIVHSLAADWSFS